MYYYRTIYRVRWFICIIDPFPGLDGLFVLSESFPGLDGLFVLSESFPGFSGFWLSSVGGNSSTGGTILFDF